MSKYEGISVEEAIAKGLKEQGLTKETASIRIVQEAKKGFLGFGKQAAIVEVTPHEQKVESQVETAPAVEVEKVEKPVPTTTKPQEVKDAPTERLSEEETLKTLAVYLTEISQGLGAPALVKIERHSDHTVLHLESKQAGRLIGKHGRVLNAIQYLAQVFIHRTADQRMSVVINVGDYRERREATLGRMAKQAARKALDTQQPVFLEPMPAFERKMIHGILSANKRIETHSEGEEPHRYLVVSPRRS